MAAREMQQCLTSWHRVLNSGFQRTEILKIFSSAECLPPHPTWAKEIEKQISRFIKIGKMEMISLEVMWNPINKGGLGMVCIRSKADYWHSGCRYSQGLYIESTWGSSPVGNSKLARLWGNTQPPWGSSLLWRGELQGQVNTTAKESYTAYTDSLPPPRVEYINIMSWTPATPLNWFPSRTSGTCSKTRWMRKDAQVCVEIRKIWCMDIARDFFMILAQRISRRIQAVLEANNSHTKYWGGLDGGRRSETYS